MEREIEYELIRKRSREREERDAMYRIVMGLTTLDVLPPYLLTNNICIAACSVDPLQYQYVPGHVRPYFPDPLTDRCRDEMIKRNLDPDDMSLVYEREKQYRFKLMDYDHNGVIDARDSAEYYRRQAEINYRLNTGDYNHDGVVDKKDKQIERDGYAFADI